VPIFESRSADVCRKLEKELQLIYREKEEKAEDSNKSKRKRCMLNILDQNYKKEPAQEREGYGNFVLYLALKFHWSCTDILVEKGYYYNLMMALCESVKGDKDARKTLNLRNMRNPYLK
jgi:hypothetical protein